MAAQDLSGSVAAGIHTHAKLGALLHEASHTAQFSDRIDKLFDKINSCQVHHCKDSRCAIIDTNGLIELHYLISSLKIIGSKRSLLCIFGWQLNNESLKCLSEDLRSTYQFKDLMTKRLNQDSREIYLASSEMLVEIVTHQLVIFLRKS